MKFLGAMLLATSVLVGCATDGTSTAQQNGQADGNITEPVLYDGQLCSFEWLGTNSPNAETFFIWNMGVDSWDHAATYPSDARPDLYGIFAPAPASETHHVDGWDQFDHYHVVTAGPSDAGYTGEYDVFLIFPGPNFDASTYTVATNAAEVQQQIDAGILGPALKTTDAGFEPLVLRTPLVNCHAL